MNLPNKVTPFADSVVSKFPTLLGMLEKQDMSPKKLFDETRRHFSNIGEYISTLDCLYALGKLQLDEDKGVLRYVEDDSE
jgi:hypothetical protein